MNIVIAFDCGTTSMKAAALHISGRLIGSVDASYRISHPRPGWAEQDPEELWATLCLTSRQLLDKTRINPGDVAAICFVAPWKNIIPIGRAGNVLHPSIIWMDGRAGREAQTLNAQLGRVVGTGQEYWPRLMWLKHHQPDVWAKARHVVGLNSYFKWRATGEFCTEPSDDFIHGSTPNQTASYREILDAAGLASDRDRFPSPSAATNIVGSLTKTAGPMLGLKADTPVVGGFGDIPAIAAGAGRFGPGDAHIYLGTSSWFLVVAPAGSTLPAPLTATLTDRTKGLVYPLQTGCLARDWIVEQTYHAELQQLGPGIHALVDEQVSQVAPGADSLLATHWLNGELPPLSKHVRGMYLNLTPRHDRRHLVRAMLEAISFTHRMSIAAHLKVSGQAISQVRAVGGGAVSPVWMQILADVLQIPVEVPEHPRLAGIRGAFACAVVGLGASPSIEAWIGDTSESATYQPSSDNAPVYGRLYDAYAQLHDAVAPIFDLLEPSEPHPAAGSQT